MGECINLRRGGKAKKLPVLNANYPANASVDYKGGATFKVEITTHGYPEEYTYQWYKNGSAISGATGISYTVSNQTESATIYCKVTNAAGTVQSRTATLTVASALPNYTYSGGHQLVDDGNGNWRLKLTSSGTLRFTNLGTGKDGVDVFLVGGGGGGSSGGGGGGYTNTVKGKTLAKNTDYWIDVGAGGARSSSTSASGSNGGNGGASAFNAIGLSANGGNTGDYGSGGAGGSGGGALYKAGASDGGTAASSSTGVGGTGGAGQGRTTREFAESGGTLYAGGGGGGAGSSTIASGAGGAGGGGEGGNQSSGGLHKGDGYAGTDGLGGGGGGRWSGYYSGKGGSGIVIIRNKR